MQDKRKDKRFNARWKAALAYTGATRKPIFHTLTHDLSVNGTSVQSNEDEPINTVLTMLLIPPVINGVEQKVIKLKSVIMSSRPFRNGYRLGLSFVHDSELEKLWAILNSLDLSGEELPSDPEHNKPAPAPTAAPAPAAAPAAAPALSALELIKQRALTKKLSEDQIAASRLEAEKKLFRRMSDSLHAAHKYFTELTTQLNELKPEYSGTYVLLNVANFGGLVWKDDARSSINPRPRNDDKEAPVFDRLTVTFTLSSPGEMKVERDPLVADRTEKQLDETGFTYRKQYTRNAQGHLTNTIFFLTCEIKARLIISCDEAGEKLRLDATNLERFGRTSYEMEIEALNQAVFDQLTLAMMGEANTLGKLIKRTV